MFCCDIGKSLNEINEYSISSGAHVSIYLHKIYFNYYYKTCR